MERQKVTGVSVGWLLVSVGATFVLFNFSTTLAYILYLMFIAFWLLFAGIAAEGGAGTKWGLVSGIFGPCPALPDVAKTSGEQPPLSAKSQAKRLLSLGDSLLNMLFEWVYALINTALVIFLIVGPAVYFFLLIFLFKDELKRSLLQVGFLFLLTVIFLNKLLFGFESLAQQDFNNIQIPFFHFFNASITKYFLPPLWNSAFCGGVDVFSNPLAGYFSMFNWLFLLGSSVYASFNFFIFIQIFLCAAFSYLMLRTFSFSKASSVLGAVLFSFNGFVTMRLSPGVGIEYLFAYKWLPLIFAFSKRFFDQGNPRNLLGLAIAFAFSLEGNPSMVIASGVLWFIYVCFEYKKLVLHKLKIFLAPVLSLFIYALKILPVVDLFKNGELRFASSAGGWRAANFDLYMFPKVFFPIKPEFTNGIFTPGVIGMTLFVLGLILALLAYRNVKKSPFEGFYFVLFVFVLSFFITIENPLYYFFYSLPILNKTTIIPPFLIFYLFPIVFFASYGGSDLFKKKRLVFILVSVSLPLLVFAEILLGPSTFGADTYSFNFAKMDYKKEPFDFPHFNLLSTRETGSVLVKDYPHIFVYPYAVSLENLMILNSPNYFFGCNDDTALIQAGVPEIKKRADYVLTMYPVQDAELELIDVVSLTNLLEHKSHAVFERKADYLALYETGWSDDLYVYKVKCSKECAAKNHSRNPVEFTVTGGPSTAVNYSKWLKIKGASGFLSTYADEFGYLGVNSSEQDLKFFYVNPYIYSGFALSLIAFVFVLRKF